MSRKAGREYWDENSAIWQLLSSIFSSAVFISGTLIIGILAHLLVHRSAWQIPTHHKNKGVKT